MGGRLRSRIAEQLLNELESDAHRTVVQLEELQIENRPGSGRRDTAYWRHVYLYNYNLLILEAPSDIRTIQF